MAVDEPSSASPAACQPARDAGRFHTGGVSCPTRWQGQPNPARKGATVTPTLKRAATGYPAVKSERTCLQEGPRKCALRHGDAHGVAIVSLMSQGQMRESEERRDEPYDQANEPRPAIKPVFIELHKDISWLVRPICHFTKEESFSGAHRFKQDSSGAKKTFRPVSQRSRPVITGQRNIGLRRSPGGFEASVFGMALARRAQDGNNIRRGGDNIAEGEVATLTRRQPFTPNHGSS